MVNFEVKHEVKHEGEIERANYKVCLFSRIYISYIYIS